MPDDQPSLIGRVAMPQFNWMGALLGGPSYMSNYFANQMASQQLQQQRGLDQQSANALVNSPQFAAAFPNGQQQAPGALWAESQGGNPNMAALGSSLFERSVAQAYGKDMSVFQQNLQEQMAKFDQNIRHQDTDYNANSTLNLFQKEQQWQIQNNMQAMQARWGMIADPQNAGNSMMLRSLLKMNDVNTPDGYDPMMVNGRLMFSPTPGLDPWNKMMDAVQPVQAVQKGLSDLATQLEQGTTDPSSWYATKAWTINKMKDLVGSGRMDDKVLDQMNDMIPDRLQDWNALPGPTKRSASRMLQTTLQLVNGQLRQEQQKYFLQPGSIPNVAGGPLPQPGVDIRQPTQDEINAATPMSMYGGRGPGRSPSGMAPSAPSFFDYFKPLEQIPGWFKSKASTPMTQQPGSIWARTPGSGR